MFKYRLWVKAAAGSSRCRIGNAFPLSIITGHRRTASGDTSVGPFNADTNHTCQDMALRHGAVARSQRAASAERGTAPTSVGAIWPESAETSAMTGWESPE
jgi:hypothetical protein